MKSAGSDNKRNTLPVNAQGNIANPKQDKISNSMSETFLEADLISAETKTQTAESTSNGEKVADTLEKNILLSKAIPDLPQTKPVSDSYLKIIHREMKDMKNRLSKLELEVATLHELLSEQDDLTAEALAILPDLKFEDTVDEEKSCRPKRVSLDNDHSIKEPVPSSSTVPMMCNGHAWFGDVFLFELMCQYRDYRPKHNNWFNSIYPYTTFDDFVKQMFSRKKFFRSCVIAIGYTDLFNAKPVTGLRSKRLLHSLFNYMRAHGADHVKMLSVPPARQMMKNEEYLRVCQTTNRFFECVTKTHSYVDYINLDSFFINNPNDSYVYFSGGEISVQILDNLLMRKEEEKFAIYVEPETAKRLIDYVSNYETESKMSIVNKQPDYVEDEVEYDQVERFNDHRQCKRLLSTPHTPKSVDYSEANDEGAYDYPPPQSTYARRYDSSRNNSSGRKTPGPYESKRYRSPLRKSSHRIPSLLETNLPRILPLELVGRSQVRDSHRRSSSEQERSQSLRNSNNSRRIFENAQKSNTSVELPLRDNKKDHHDSKNNIHEYSESNNSDLDHIPCYRNSLTNKHENHRTRSTGSPHSRSVVQKSRSPPPWLKKTQAMSDMSLRK